ncbi:MAG: DUF447 family protein [Planctomycetales bacterium]|nr:DUF447 family protein [Planctomycetales bacterium]
MTTIDADGRVNIAPMGPVVTMPSAMQSAESCDPGFILRPFAGSRTFDNLIKSRRAAIHVTDDAALFARAAVGRIDAGPSMVRLLYESEVDQTGEREAASWAILRQCHRWFAVEVTDINDTPPRFDMRCRVVRSAIEAPFFGFNRAKHAVIETAILATRTNLIDADDIRAQVDALRPLVEKTAGDDERDAFDSLVAEIESVLQRTTSSGAP